jgi:hypothetical protein
LPGFRRGFASAEGLGKASAHFFAGVWQSPYPGKKKRSSPPPRQSLGGGKKMPKAEGWGQGSKKMGRGEASALRGGHSPGGDQKKEKLYTLQISELQTKRKMRFLKFFLSIFYVKSKKNKISSSS